MDRADFTPAKSFCISKYTAPAPSFTQHLRCPSSTSPDSLPVPILPCWAPVTHSRVQGPFIHSAVSCVTIRASGQRREKLISLKGAKQLWVPPLHNSNPGATVLTSGPARPQEHRAYLRVSYREEV